MIWDPIHFLEVCPSSDGAAAMVMTNAAGAKRAPRPPAWVIAHAKRTEFAVFPGRDPVKPAALMSGCETRSVPTVRPGPWISEEGL